MEEDNMTVDDKEVIKDIKDKESQSTDEHSTSPAPPLTNSVSADSGFNLTQAVTTEEPATLPSPFVCHGRQFHLQVKDDPEDLEKRKKVRSVVEKRLSDQNDFRETQQANLRRLQEHLKHKRTEVQTSELHRKVQCLEQKREVLRMMLSQAEEE